MEESDDDEKNIDPNKVYNCIKAIFNYEREVEKMSNNYVWDEQHLGFIIKLLDYEKYKNKIQYDALEKYINDENLCKKEINKLIESNKINDIFVEFNSLNKINKNDFINSITKNKIRYKLINKELWDIIHNPEKSPLMYLIDYPEINIFFDKKDTINNSIISFSCNNNNILDLDSYIGIKENKLMNIAKSIIEFHKFESEIEFNLKDKKEDIQKYSGYFISKNWVDNWKSYINYDRINFDEKEYDLIFKIMKQLFGFLKGKKFGRKMFELEVLNFKTADEFEKYLQKGSLVLINEIFYYLVNKQKVEIKNENHFTASDGIINVYLKSGEIKIASYGNIILRNNIKKIEYFIENKDNLKKINIKEPIFENEDDDEQSLWSSFTFIGKKNKPKKERYNGSNDKLNNISLKHSANICCKKYFFPFPQLFLTNRFN